MERVTGSIVKVSSPSSAQKDTEQDEPAHFRARRVKARKYKSELKMKSSSEKPEYGSLINHPSVQKFLKSEDFEANCKEVFRCTPIGEFGDPIDELQEARIFTPFFGPLGVGGRLPISPAVPCKEFLSPAVPCKEFLEETIPCNHCVVRVPRDEHFDFMVGHLRRAHPEKLQNYLQNK